MSSSSGNSRADNSARRPVLFVQRCAVAGPGAFAEVLGECGLSWRCTRLHAGDVLPRGLDDWSLLVILSDHAVSAAEDGTQLDGSLLELVSLAVERDFPTIGVGSGADLLLRAARGVAPVRSGDPETGWHTVELTASGRSDPALSHLPTSFPAFEWRRHHLDVPQGVVVLAATEARGCQAFRVGERVYGFEFHPEVTGWMVGRWIDAYPDANGGRPEAQSALHRETSENADGSRQLMRELLRGLLPALGVVPPGMGPVVNRSIG